jgi:protein O-mannosyl-transferase
MSDPGAGPARTASGTGETLSLVAIAGVALAFALLTLSVYRGALSGPFLSDDDLLIVTNPYLARPLAELIPAAFAPSGEARQYAGGNYAPVLHLAHAVEGRLFRGDTRGYHLVNVAVHALNGALLFALLLQAGLPRGASLFASALFVLHPANVEAVAWISQLRTLLAMAGALSALLFFPRAPIASAALFGFGLLAKASASFALPMVAVFAWSRSRPGRPVRREWAGVAAWLIVFAIYAPIQMSVFSTMSRAVVDPYPDAWSHLRGIAAIAARYLAMAATGYGASAYHEPEPVRSNLDPWWLAGVVAGVCLAARTAWTLRRRDPEAGWWLGAVAAWAPISQWLPFMFAMGDRYLYFALPGLLGGGCLAARDACRRVEARIGVPFGARKWLRPVAIAGAALWIAAFAAQASRRAPLWQAEGLLLQDAATHYPDGAVGHYVRAVLALEQRDPDTALAELRRSAERGGGFSHPFFGDPWLMPLFADPRFRDLIRDMAQMEIDAARGRPPANQSQLYILANAHYLRGERDEAISLLEQCLRVGGPLDADALRLTQRLRLERSGRSETDPFSSLPVTGPKPSYDFPSGRKLAADEWPES